MDFEFDPAKSSANKTRHGIDFDEAQALWDDRNLLEAPARTGDVPRFIVVGTIRGRHRSAMCTLRGERIRIITVRRARKEGVERYESP